MRRNLFEENRPFFLILSGWLIVFLFMRTLQHLSFGTNTYDLSIFDYGMYYTLKGQLMCEPFHPHGWASHFAVHFTPVLLLIVPLYLVLTGPLFLLYLQVLFVGAAAVPLYFIALSWRFEKRVARLVALVYLLNRSLLNGLMYDFHPEMLLPLFVFSSYYYLRVRRNPGRFFLFILLALMIKEDVAVYVFFYGLYIAWVEKEKWVGLLTAAFAAFYGAVTMWVVIPAFRLAAGISGGYEFLGQWVGFGGDLGEILAHILSDPGAAIAALPLGSLLAKTAAILSGLLFLPLLSHVSWLMIPPLAVALVSRIPTLATLGLHYFAGIAPFLFLGFLFGLHRVGTWTWDAGTGVRRTVFRVVLVLLLVVTLANTKWNVFRPADYRFIEDYPAARAMIREIPRSASVAALSALIPHIPKRPDISILPDLENAEYVLIHDGINPWPMTGPDRLGLIERLEGSKAWEVLKRDDALVLFRRTTSASGPRGSSPPGP